MQIDDLIQKGKDMLEHSQLEDYETWKRSVQFYIEDQGSLSITKEIEKEVNRSPFYIFTSSTPKSEIDETFRTHKISTIERIISILEAVKLVIGQKKAEKSTNSGGRKFTKTVQTSVWIKQDGKCKRCQSPLNPASTHYDHIKQWKDGGKSEEENCQALCANCHGHKTHEDRLKEEKLKKLPE